MVQRLPLYRIRKLLLIVSSVRLDCDLDTWDQAQWGPLDEALASLDIRVRNEPLLFYVISSRGDVGFDEEARGNRLLPSFIRRDEVCVDKGLIHLR